MALVIVIFAYTYFVYIKDYSQNSEEFNEEKYYLYSLSVTDKMRTVELSDDFKEEISNLCNNVEVSSLQDLTYLKYTCEEFNDLFSYSNPQSEDSFDWASTYFEREIRNNMEELFRNDDYFITYQRRLSELNNNLCVDTFGTLVNGRFIEVWGERGFLTKSSEVVSQVEKGNAIIPMSSSNDIVLFAVCKQLKIDG